MSLKCSPGTNLQLVEEPDDTDTITSQPPGTNTKKISYAYMPIEESLLDIQMIDMGHVFTREGIM